MIENLRRKIWSYSPVYQRTYLKILVILLMETLTLSSQQNYVGINESECKDAKIERLKNATTDSKALENMKEVDTFSQSNELNSCNILELPSVMVQLAKFRQPDTPGIGINAVSNSHPAPHSITELKSKLGLVLNATSNLLSSAHIKAWMGLPPHYQSKTATRLLVGMEMISDNVAKVAKRSGSIIKRAPEIEGLHIDIINITEAQLQKSLIIFNDSGLQLELGLEDVKRRVSKTDGLGRTAFIQYKNIGRWLKSSLPYSRYNVTTENKSYVRLSIITNVFSASIFPRTEHRTKLNGSIRFTLTHKISPLNSPNVSCVFWNFSPDDFVGHWSEEGCEVVSSNDYNTTCECDHLTHFAVLMSSVDKEISTKHEFALQIITYIGCTISIMSLALALFTFCFFRNLQCDRNTIHKNLAFSLLIAQLIFVFGITQYDKETLCAVVAGFLHYFFLASFAWMCLEGVQLYVLLVEVFEIEKSRVKWYYLGGYGTPALIVLASVSVMAFSAKGASGAYGTKKHCWLSTEAGFIWAFNGPVIAVFAVNLVMLGLAIYMMCRHSSSASWKLKTKSKIQEIGSWLRGAAIIMVLLGTTWIFGIFLNFDSQTVVFEYIFAILNSFQGLFIFVFHCLTNDKVQKEYERAIQRSTYLPECIRAKYGDMNKGGVLSTSNKSRSSEKTNLESTSSENRARVILSSPQEETWPRQVNAASESTCLTDSSGYSDHLESFENSRGYRESVISNLNESKFNVQHHQIE